jgi:hypothetical protein
MDDILLDNKESASEYEARLDKEIKEFFSSWYAEDQLLKIQELEDINIADYE